MASKGYEHVTPAEMKRLLAKGQARLPGKARSKYGSVKTTVDGIVFDSAKEARRWQVLSALARAGQIRKLARQLGFSLRVGTTVIGTYTPDFLYEERVGEEWVQRVEDVKSVATRKKELYRWKAKHFRAQYGIQILET